VPRLEPAEELTMTLKPIAALVAAAGLALAPVAFAADKVSAEAYKAEKDKIDASYKAEMERCDSQTGNAKDICKAQAKGKHKAAKADAEAQYRGTAKAQADARIAHADADYDVAKQKCDELAGNKKDVCMKDAKAVHVKAKADAKVARSASEPRHTGGKPQS
jgi:hypothetical protein